MLLNRKNGQLINLFSVFLNNKNLHFRRQKIKHRNEHLFHILQVNSLQVLMKKAIHCFFFVLKFNLIFSILNLLIFVHNGFFFCFFFLYTQFHITKLMYRNGVRKLVDGKNLLVIFTRLVRNVFFSQLVTL